MEFCKQLFDRSALDKELELKLRNRKIVYITAHAGWGKTIALQAWVRTRSHARYICARELLSGEALSPKPSVWVIDNLQDLSEAEMQKRLLPLLTEASSRKFICLSRAEVPSLLCPFMLTGQLAVLEESALCLSRDTVDSYLAATDIPYSVDNSTFLVKESHGYPVAVDCLTEVLKTGAPCTEQTVAKATQAIFDYLEQVVFSRFSQEAQTFLLKMAAFPEFTLRMAEMVSGDKEIIRVLDGIMRRGKSIAATALDTYGFPHLFHRFLLYYQKRKCSDAAICDIWRRAGLYYELCDDFPHALHCYRQVDDWDKLVELLIRHTRRPTYTTSFFELKDYYLALPPALVERSPDLMGSVSMIYSMTMREKESEYWYDQLERFYRTGTRSAAQKKAAGERLAFLRIALPHRGSRKIARTLLDLAKLMQGEGLCIQSISATSGIPSLMHGAKDFCHWSRKDEQLYRVFKKPVELLLGKAGVGVADAGLAESRLERCTLTNITDVMVHASSAINQAEQTGTLDVYFAAAATIMRLSVMQGNLLSAQKNLDYVEQRAREESNGRLLANVRAFRTRLLLLEGKTAEVNRWVQEAAPDEIAEFQLLNRYQYMVKVRCYLQKGDNLAAIMLLTRMIPCFEMSEQRYCLMEARMLLSIAQYRMGQSEWPTLLLQALEPMEHYGFLRLPAEEGAALLPLLNALPPENHGEFYLSMLHEVTRYAQLYPDYLKPAAPPMQALTQTEKQVLQLLVRGLKNVEIADALSISVRTVKFHTGNIYAKINVNSRTEAIALSRKIFE